MCFDGAVVDHNDALDPNSNFAIKINNPKNFIISPVVVGDLLAVRSCSDASCVVNVSRCGGNINRKQSSRDQMPLRSDPLVIVSPTGVLIAKSRSGKRPLIGDLAARSSPCQSVS